MKIRLISISLLCALATSAGMANAGCGKGALVGGAAGHLAGKHGLVGAAAGCAVGSHMSKKKAREHAAQQPATPSAANAPVAAPATTKK